MDILYLFPSGIGIHRNLAAFSRRRISPMDECWGGRDWRDLPRAKIAAGQQLRADEILNIARPWVEGFRSKLKELGFLYQDESDPVITNEQHVAMYHLLFFSKHSAGLNIWKNIKKIEPGGQRKLPI